MRLTALLALFAAPALAECPPQALPPEHEMLVQRLATAADEGTARAATNALWPIWLTAPDARAQSLLDAGMRAQRRGDFAAARAEFDALIDYCPDYAEGWNQRAFTAYLARDFEAALADLDAAMARAPYHTGVVSGRALTLLGMGREAEGQQALREALRLNPWLAERRLLTIPPEESL